MAYKGDLLAMCHQFFDRPRKRIQAAREQNDLVGRKFASSAPDSGK